MADLSDIQAAQSIKIVGADATGAEGNVASVDIYSSLNVQPTVGTIFSDNFDGAQPFDTVNRWNLLTANGGINTQSNGDNILSTTTAASSSVQLSSKPTFASGASSYYFGSIVQFESPLQTNTHRFWGIGTPEVSFTAANPLLDAIGFEIDTAANLSAVIYAAGVKIFSTNLNAYKNANPNLFVVSYWGNSIYWFINTFTAPVAASPGYIVNSFTLPIRIHAVNGTTPPASATSLKINGIAVVDTNPTAVTNISDGLYAWRKASVKPQGAQTLSTDNELLVRAALSDGAKTTYSASITNLVAATTATDIFTISGSATKTVRVLLIGISGTQNVATNNDIILLKRSTLNTGGISTSPTEVPHDSSNSAATAIVKAYTANPTLGTLIGILKSSKLTMSTTSGNGNVSQSLLRWDFGTRPGQAIILRGVNEMFSINFNGVTAPGNLIDINIEWTEE